MIRKKMTAIAMAALMLVGVFPVAARADDYDNRSIYVYEYSNGNWYDKIVYEPNNQNWQVHLLTQLPIR